MRFGIAILRAVIGGLFVGHGLQKLTGAFGGHGLEGTAGFFESALGLRPGKLHATTAAVAETAGGAALVAGFATPAAAAALTGTMTVAIHKVHGKNGIWAQDGGFEYPLVMIAALYGIVAEGPGSMSVDRREWGSGWATAAIAAGVVGALGLVNATSQGGSGEADSAADPANVPSEPVGAVN
jgi:putative oxidoreductase